MKIKIKSNEPLYLENKGFLVYLVDVTDEAGQAIEYLAYVYAELIEDIDSDNCPTKQESCIEEIDGSFKHLNTVVQSILDNYKKYVVDVVFQPYIKPISVLEKKYHHNPMLTDRVKYHGFWHVSFLNDREVAIWF